MSKLVQLKEQRAAKIGQVDEILKGIEANGEVRALNAEERSQIANLTNEIEDLKATIDLMDENSAKTPEQKVELKEKEDWNTKIWKHFFLLTDNEEEFYDIGIIPMTEKLFGN